MVQSIFKRGGVVMFLVGLSALFACQATTVAPGVEQTGKETRTTIAATPKVVAEAAAVVLQELELSDVRGMATRMDGRVTAMTSLGDVVEVIVVTAGSRTSSLSVSNDAGKGLALEILQEIEARVYGQPSPNAGSNRGAVMFNPGQSTPDSAIETTPDVVEEEGVEESAPAAAPGIVPLDQLPPPRVDDPADSQRVDDDADSFGTIKKR